jgi:hypothetical protein
MNSADETAIPKFNLAEDIMAEQRKITAIRRKAPDKKSETQSHKQQVEPIDNVVQRPVPSEQDRMIAEIVSRDIERLCRGEKSV